MARRPAPLKRQRNSRAEEIRAQYTEVAGTRARLPLSQISDRVHGDTRELNEQHVIELMESIEILGLISPLTVDREGTLLAGGHRRAALRLLAEHNPSCYDANFSEGIPVYRLELLASEAPIEALQIEIEENTQRKNYSPDEIRAAAKKLEAVGYEKLKGRPREGQKSLKQALQRIFKLSDRRIQSILNDDPKQSTPAHLQPVSIKTIRFAQKKALKGLEGLENQLSRFPNSTKAQQSALLKIRKALQTLKDL
jgi:ParB family transcriptional regulator, chromosome partitioning protein